MGPTIVFRTTSARVYAVIFWVVAAALLVAFGTNGGLRELMQYGAVPLTLGVIGWAVFWRPQVVVAPAGVTAVNVLTTAEVPWAVIEKVETQWGLRLQTTEGRVSVWAAPAKGAMSSRRREADLPAVDLLDTDGTGHLSADGDAHLVGQVIETRLAAGAGAAAPAGRAGSGSATSDGSPGVRRRVDAVVVAAIVGSLALAVLTATALG